MKSGQASQQKVSTELLPRAEPAPDADDAFLAFLKQVQEAQTKAPPPKPEELWLGKSAPRYTSYPPATAFRSDVTARDYTSAVMNIPADDAVSLYLHIPFCHSLCLYCGCHTSVARNNERIEQYLAGVKNELRLLATLAEWPRPVSHLHFGGGSPNIMTSVALQELFATLARTFDLRSCKEIAMELDPRMVTSEQIKTLAACGVTRVSLGVQDFNPEVQKMIGREQSFALIQQLCQDVRAAGIKSINFDLMYGLPGQTPESLAATAKQVCALLPDRVALFSYAHLPQLKPHQKELEKYVLPDKQSRLFMELAAREVLIEAGYEAIGMDHFARPDDSLAVAAAEKRLHRNFQGYTDDGASTLLGVGASSISRTRNGFFQNEKNPRLYENMMRREEFATVRGLLLTGDDRVRAAIIEELMSTLSCDIEAVCRYHNYALAALTPEMEALKPFEEAGVLSRDKNRITLATLHRMAIRAICRVFDRATTDDGSLTSSVM